MTEGRDLEKLNNYLTKNNNEKINDFINGYITVGDIKEEADINHKYLVYYALKRIVPDAQEQREQKQIELCFEMVERINQVVPFERMNLKHVKQLLGRREDVELKDEMIKAAITRKRNMYNLEEDKGFDLVSQSRFQTWYKNVRVYRDIQNEEGNPSQIARRYGIIPRKIYEKLNFFEENKNEGRILPRVSMEQQGVFLENVAIYDAYNEGLTIKEISEQYNIQDYLIKELIISFEEVEEKIAKKK